MIAGIVVLYEPDMERLKRISEYCDTVDHFFIVDNSKDDNFDKVNIAFQNEIKRYEGSGISEEITYYHCEKNVGLCAALNFGIDAARKTGCDWTLIMDDDSTFGTNVVKVYKEFLDSSDIAVLAPVHLHDRSKAQPYDGVREIKWAMTSGCLYNNEIFDKLGGFMEDLFVDGLDIDYCYRAIENGFRVVECGKASIIHHPCETRDFKVFGKTILKYGYSSPWRYQMQCRSLVWTFLRYRHVKDLVMYGWKWVKAIVFFSEKNKYFHKMIEGSKEGKALYRKYIGVR